MLMTTDVKDWGAMADIARATGLNYSSVWHHVHGSRRISAKSALIYEAKLGIPRSKLGPDLWPPEQEVRPAGDQQDRPQDGNL